MRKWLIVILLIIVFILSVLCGFIINSYIKFSNEKEENSAILANENNNETVDTSYSDIIISPNAEIVLTEKFEKCGHTRTNKEIVPREIVNLNKDKVIEYYKNWNIDEFSSDKISISRTSKGICDQHYILRESDGFVSINCKNDIGEYIFKGLTDISTQYLPQEDLEKLEKGIEVVGRDNLNKILEDFE